MVLEVGNPEGRSSFAFVLRPRGMSCLLLHIIFQKQTNFIPQSLGSDSTSQGWVFILLLVFLLNVFILIYFLVHRGLVTDFSEPPNLFTLAVNSPPSHLLAGSCGGGPEGKHYRVNWFVNTEGDHLFMEPAQKSGVAAEHTHPHSHAHGQAPTLTPATKPGLLSSVSSWTTKLWNRGDHKRNRPQPRPASLRGMDLELEQANTRTQRRYEKLANRRSFL